MRDDMVFNPGLINILHLPTLPLASRRQFPEYSCVYLAIDSSGTVQYVGQSMNLRRRWANHHKFCHLEEMGCIQIAWIEASYQWMLNEMEEGLIKRFNPPLNGRPGIRTAQSTLKVTLTIKNIWPEGLSLEQAEEEMDAMGVHLNRRTLSNLRRGTESGDWATPYKLAKYLSVKIGREITPQDLFEVED